MGKVEFGVALPTGMDGLMYPPPFTTPEVIITVAQRAENLGYDHVWGNEHLTTQNYVRAEFETPPSFYDPLVSLSFCAANTKRIRLATCVTVIPMHDPVILAKQAISLDRFSGGRFILGAGTGAYREEFEAVRPHLAATAKRAEIIDEGLEALQLLFTQRVASYEGKYFKFKGVEMFPKPLQNPLPIYVGGNAEAVAKRAGRFGQGWMPAGMPVERLIQLKEVVRAAARDAGRDGERIVVAPQFLASIARDDETAQANFRKSQVYKHAVSLSASTLRGQAVETLVQNNLIGSFATVKDRVKRYIEAGVDCFAGIIFTGQNLKDVLEQMDMFASEVMAGVIL